MSLHVFPSDLNTQVAVTPLWLMHPQGKSILKGPNLLPLLLSSMHCQVQICLEDWIFWWSSSTKNTFTLLHTQSFISDFFFSFRAKATSSENEKKIGLNDEFLDIRQTHNKCLDPWILIFNDCKWVYSTHVWTALVWSKCFTLVYAIFNKSLLGWILGNIRYNVWALFLLMSNL